MTRNQHTIVVEADSARPNLEIENVPTVENPKTGKITALSVITPCAGKPPPWSPAICPSPHGRHWTGAAAGGEEKAQSIGDQAGRDDNHQIVAAGPPQQGRQHRGNRRAADVEAGQCA